MIIINTSHILPDTPYLLDGTESADILELPADADPPLAASLPVPDPAGLARFRQDMQTSLVAGLPLGWTLRRRTAGPRHRRLIIGFDPDTDRILTLDLFPPYAPRFMPLTAAWCQTIGWQVLQGGER